MQGSKFFIFVSLAYKINSYREKYINKAIDLWVEVRYYKCKLVITNETKKQGGTMRQEVFEIVQKMDKDNIRTQMALQCAPLITGLKVANLLIIPSKNEKYVGAILDGTDISYIRLAKSECKTTFFLYREERLTAWLMRAENRALLTEAGYSGIILSDILQTIQMRYEAYVQKGKAFPHEIGVLLGYPAEDVKGFVVNEGKNYLYSGYWKVYGDLSEAKQLFYKFDRAKEALIELVSRGIGIRNVIESCSSNLLLDGAA